MKRVVIAGMGFGGLSAAKELAGRGLEVVMVDRHNYHLFQPLLYQVATAGLEQESIAYPVRAFLLVTKLQLGNARALQAPACRDRRQA